MSSPAVNASDVAGRARRRVRRRRQPIPFFAAKARTENHLLESGLAWTIDAPHVFLSSGDCAFKLIERHVRCVGVVRTNPPPAVVRERLPDEVFTSAILKADVDIWRSNPPPPRTHVANSVDLA
jgi:uncharacterized protein YbjT (DUF2867 family)